MVNVHFNKKRFLQAVGLLVLVGASIYCFTWFQARPLTAEQLNTKFDCNRVTADVRETDVFCGQLAWYNDPEAISLKEYYELHDCAGATQSKPSTGTKTTYSGLFTTRYDCQNPVKMKQHHQEFIHNLQKLKANYR